ncbi:hypothetical protein [Halorussus halophilus]|uniref:hypothetical protein n=1 Tax=Halorussus halophilus TaxID=2650975 RepID=UPI00130133BD|nr:hypothetical protein [Halorussus halophilus]
MTWPEFDVHPNPEEYVTTYDFMELPTTSADHRFEVRVEKVAEFSQTHPGTFCISLTNTGTETLRTMFGITPPFSRYFGTNQSDKQLVVIPLHSRDTSVNKERLVPDEPPWRAVEDFDIPQVGTTIILDAGESVSDEYAILLPTGLTSEYHSGQYQFSDQVKFQLPDEERLNNKFEWSFTVEIEPQSKVN